MTGTQIALSSMTSKFALLSPSSTSAFAFLTKAHVFLFALLIFSLASVSAGVSVAESGEDVEPTTSQDPQMSSSVPTSRVKRSRDTHQLCGYRLLDALRTLCDRNFVGLTRRSDPNLFMQSGEGQSGEEFGSGALFRGTFSDLSPWEILTFELPSANQIGGDNPASSSSDLSDYMESWQHQGTSNSFVPGRSNGFGGTKGLALKLLAESPKTHQRFRRNIIDECCKKPCAAHQMLKYCAIAAVGKRSF